MLAEKGGSFGYWRDPIFLICVAIYVINRILIKPNLHQYSPLFHGHLNDSLTVPVLLPIYLLVYRRIGLRPDDQPPRWWEVALHLAVWDVFFKWYGPVVMHVGVYDPLDIWCITGGGFVAWMLWQRIWLIRTLMRDKEPGLQPRP